MLDIVVHRDARLSDVTVPDILDSYHLPILFHIPDHVNARDLLAPVEIYTDRGRFWSLTSDLISPRIRIDTLHVAERAACTFAASVTLASPCGDRGIRIVPP
jgi:hypothetical protein